MALGNQEVGGGAYDENAVSLGALAKGISPFFALVSLKDEKGHLLLFSYWEDEWDNTSQAPNTGQKKKKGAAGTPSCTVIELCLLLGWVIRCKAIETIPSVMKDQGEQEARIVLLTVQRTLPLFREQGEGDACQGIKKKILWSNVHSSERALASLQAIRIQALPFSTITPGAITFVPLHPHPHPREMGTIVVLMGMLGFKYSPCQGLLKVSCYSNKWEIERLEIHVYN